MSTPHWPLVIDTIAPTITHQCPSNRVILLLLLLLLLLFLLFLLLLLLLLLLSHALVLTLFFFHPTFVRSPRPKLIMQLLELRRPLDLRALDTSLARRWEATFAVDILLQSHLAQDGHVKLLEIRVSRLHVNRRERAIH
jgi:hypothetical protein